MDKRSIHENQHKLFRVVTTVSELCTDRKYVVPADWLPPSLEAFRLRYCDEADGSVQRDKLLMVCRRYDNTVMLVAFPEDVTVRPTTLQKYQQMAAAEGILSVLLVIKGKVTPTVKPLLRPGRPGSLRFELFEEDHLAVNITRHELVPKHIPLEAEELQEVLKGHSLQPEMLPRILSTDPIASYFGLQHGNVVKIIRRSETAGEYVTYRRVL